MTSATPRKEKALPVRTPTVSTTVDGRSASRPIVYRSEGHRLMCEVAGSLGKIAVSVGASKQSVAWWKAGEKVPGDAFRGALEKLHGIPAKAWEQAPSAQSMAVPPAPTTPRLSSAPGTAEEYDDLIKVCIELINVGELKPSDRLRAVAEVRALRAQKDRQQRHAKKPISDKDITRSVTWASLKEALGSALKPYPEALAAVVDTLKRLDI